ncbi:MAG: hypothetical protein HKL84_04860, partial [Acidimicrobiaceae bacterium]|nr:hypothetical protein [Acidimicrobiaceae bacterium]
METTELGGRAESILRGVARFCSNNGLGGDPSVLSSPEIIEAYLIKGLADRASSTKGTYRWALGRILEVGLGDGLSFRGSIAARPY